MMVRLLRILIASAILAGCASEFPQRPESLQAQMVWLRLDGQRGTGNPALTRQFEIDRNICLGSTPSDTEVGATAKACMNQKGYIQVPVDQAEMKIRELAAANARR
jgi:hypothetical protein